MPRPSAILVLGMHRSGTSCLTGMLAIAGGQVPGTLVRNWDNALGHFESTAVVRLNEAVLARSGGHWLAPPSSLHWDPEHARQRDALLTSATDGLALIKDPRCLLTLPFWLAARPAPLVIGIVRHPLAVARSLLAWRRIPLPQGLDLWQAHNRPLLELAERSGPPLLDFDAAPEAFITAVTSLARTWCPTVDPAAIAAAYRSDQIHHDEVPGDAPVPEACLHLHRALCQRALVPGGAIVHRAFPWQRLTDLEAALAGDRRSDALAAARAGLAETADGAAFAVPAIAEFLRRHRPAEALALLAGAAGLDPALVDLLAAKIHLDAGDALAAVERLSAATAVADPHVEALLLLPQAMRRAGRAAEARVRLAEVADRAIYPFRPRAQLATWAWEDGDRLEALDLLHTAVAEAPPWRRGRLLERLALWLEESGDPHGAAEVRTRVATEDPTWAARR